MPGFYADGEYDVAGFIVGLVDRAHLIDGSAIVPGDVLIGVPSSGLHTNGYSLARSIAFDRLGLGVDEHVAELGTTVGAALLAPHRSYLPLVRPLLRDGAIKGMAHITGGGITDNLPRVLPDGTEAVVDLAAWEVPPIFRWLATAGAVPQSDMLRAFNMGVGLVIVVAAPDQDRVLRALADPAARVIGVIRSGPHPQVHYTGPGVGV
jgi:phosphoribosylformylglycinamidine cyclo-ligase